MIGLTVRPSSVVGQRNESAGVDAYCHLAGARVGETKSNRLGLNPGDVTVVGQSVGINRKFDACPALHLFRSQMFADRVKWGRSSFGTLQV